MNFYTNCNSKDRKKVHVGSDFYLIWFNTRAIKLDFLRQKCILSFGISAKLTESFHVILSFTDVNFTVGFQYLTHNTYFFVLIFQIWTKINRHQKTLKVSVQRARVSVRSKLLHNVSHTPGQPSCGWAWWWREREPSQSGSHGWQWACMRGACLHEAPRHYPKAPRVENTDSKGKEAEQDTGR